MCVRQKGDGEANKARAHQQQDEAFVVHLGTIILINWSVMRRVIVEFMKIISLHSRKQKRTIAVVVQKTAKILEFPECKFFALFCGI